MEPQPPIELVTMEEGAVLDSYNSGLSQDEVDGPLAQKGAPPAYGPFAESSKQASQRPNQRHIIINERAIATSPLNSEPETSTAEQDQQDVTRASSFRAPPRRLFRFSNLVSGLRFRPNPPPSALGDLRDDR